MIVKILLNLGAIALTLTFGTVVTYILKSYLNKKNIIRQSTEDRWHKTPTPIFGGIGIYATFMVAMATIFIFIDVQPYVIVLVSMGSLMFFTGLIDDLIKISPPVKLTSQIVAATIVVIAGYAIPITGNAYINMGFSLFLIVCLTNSFNLLDNMDGLSAGVAIVVLLVRGLFFAYDGDWNSLLLCSILAGSIGGFLVFNYHPAKIFMGDCGSLFIGFTISALFVMTSKQSQVTVEKNILFLSLLTIPLFDTFFVSITRKFGGRKISQGGKDHLSHRLVKAGLSERMAVIFLWTLAAAIGLTAFYLYVSGNYTIVAINSSIIVLFSILFGRYLSKPEKGLGAPINENAMTIVKIFYSFKYKRYILQMLLDMACIVVGYYGAYLLRFHDLAGAMQQTNFSFSVFILMPTMIVAFTLSGVYRGTWSYIDISDVLKIGKGIILGTVITIFLLAFAFRFDNFSRGVMIINAFILMVTLPSTRASYRIFDELFYSLRDQKNTKRVLIYGAGKNGELLIRSIKRQHANSIIVGFIDDDPATWLNSIMGAKVLGTVKELPTIINKYRVDEIIISSHKINEIKINTVIQQATTKEHSIRVFMEEPQMMRECSPFVMAS